MLAIAATTSKIISAYFHRPERLIVRMACFLSMASVELLTKSVSSLTITQDSASFAPGDMRSGEVSASGLSVKIGSTMVKGFVKMLVFCVMPTTRSMETARHAKIQPSMFSTMRENVFRDSEMILLPPKRKTHALTDSTRKERTTVLKSAKGVKATTNNQEPAHPASNHGSTTSPLETAYK